MSTPRTPGPSLHWTRSSTTWGLYLGVDQLHLSKRCRKESLNYIIDVVSVDPRAILLQGPEVGGE